MSALMIRLMTTMIGKIWNSTISFKTLIWWISAMKFTRRMMTFLSLITLMTVTINVRIKSIALHKQLLLLILITLTLTHILIIVTMTLNLLWNIRLQTLSFRMLTLITSYAKHTFNTLKKQFLKTSTVLIRMTTSLCSFLMVLRILVWRLQWLINCTTKSIMYTWKQLKSQSIMETSLTFKQWIIRIRLYILWLRLRTTLWSLGMWSILKKK